MEGDRKWLPFLCLAYFLLSVESLNQPSHGCYWTESCQNKWVGGCDTGDVIINQSDDCQGFCSQSSYHPCLPFHTHFHCCKPERPNATNTCLNCRNKVDFGDEYVCCTDCSDPYITDKNTMLGYCKTGAKLAVQLKPREVFEWLAEPWSECSSPCGSGVQLRDLSCIASIDGMPNAKYPVDDSLCSAGERPKNEKPCNLTNCQAFGDAHANSTKSKRMPAWLIVASGFVAISGFGLMGFLFYKRRGSTPSGVVYIMLEGYS